MEEGKSAGGGKGVEKQQEVYKSEHVNVRRDRPPSETCCQNILSTDWLLGLRRHVQTHTHLRHWSIF